ncbi:MAG: tocopherol cyclase family protein [Candidatus Pelethousia sp.]|nr:tocopherol cyclase family protein [Candidatus Pelethousia sp.]
MTHEMAMGNNGFEGWYFKHQHNGKTVAFIPGRAKSGPFIQVIDNDTSLHFDIPSLRQEQGVIYAGDCVFSKLGASIKLPGITGSIRYGPFTSLRSPIMGPFRYLPMECRHEVISMGHDLHGSLMMDGQAVDFEGGKGYIESDSGISFPRSYLWLQCNAFSAPCSVMVSIASIPFAGLRFTGCICAIIHSGREYRLATYRGVRILSAGPERIELAQGNLLLTIDIVRTASGHPLRAPVRGRMNGIIRENNHTYARCKLWESGAQVFDLESENAGYEYVMDANPG